MDSISRKKKVEEQNDIVENPYRNPPENTLPPELIERIFASLEPGDLLVSRLVSKTWRNFVDNSPIWKWKYTQTFGHSLNLGTYSKNHHFPQIWTKELDGGNFSIIDL